MHVADVKKDYDDVTLSIPLNVLKIIAGDFDGDVLNILALKSSKFADIYEKLYNPRYNMVISRNDGLFNSDFMLIKDQLICLHQFCRLGRRDVRKIKINKKKSKNDIPNENLRKIRITRLDN